MRVSDQVVQQLLGLIQSSGIQAGERLPAERTLATQLGVSRTSLREAIQQLVSQRVLQSKVGAGTYLQSPAAQWPKKSVDPLAALLMADPSYRYDVLEARLALESSATWHAAQRATPKDKDRIRRHFDLMVEHQQCGDAEKSSHNDAQFHLAIAEASHNIVLVQVMRGLFDLVLSTVAQNRRMMFIHDSPASLPRLTAQHQSLMQAIIEGDPERARSVIGEHLEYVRTTLIQTDEDAARRARAARLFGTSEWTQQPDRSLSTPAAATFPAFPSFPDNTLEHEDKTT